MTPSAYSNSEVRAMRRFVVFVLAFCAIVTFGALVPRARFACFRNHDAGVVSAAQLPANWQSGACDDSNNHWGRPHVCQMRRTTFTLPAGRLSVETANGGISVDGENRTDVSLEAKVTAWGESESAAENVLNQIQIDTDNGDVHDRGPKSSLFGGNGYSVEYHLHVPSHLAADLHTMNGGIELSQLDGAIRFATTNGGVALRQLAGDVQGQTVNGGLDIALAGDRWQGEGLQAHTTNGGISLQVPNNYSAHLETGTVNGGISVDFPITVQGEIKNHLDTNLGSGGATLHLQTVNGGVSIRHGGGADASSSD
jgi:DUF4097 and DUF4098 domain-containing protein YvlB